MREALFSCNWVAIVVIYTLDRFIYKFSFLISESNKYTNLLMRCSSTCPTIREDTVYVSAGTSWKSRAQSELGRDWE